MYYLCPPVKQMADGNAGKWFEELISLKFFLSFFSFSFGLRDYFFLPLHPLLEGRREELERKSEGGWRMRSIIIVI